LCPASAADPDPDAELGGRPIAVEVVLVAAAALEELASASKMLAN
jgi:hypothetical protein